VDEARWLSCDEPRLMVDFLRSDRSVRSGRKLRLFACACCRRFWDLIDDERSRQAVEVGERFADDLATEQDRRAAVDAARKPNRRFSGPKFHASCAAAQPGYAAYYGATPGPDVSQCMILRCVFNPFPRVAFVERWATATVGSLASAAYSARVLPGGELDRGRLCVLSDALEEAGHDDAELLGHLRSPGPHVRGCWPVDLCLGLT
jgi:hypothetical protein